MYGSHRM
ncbi:hypothetical protein OIU78_027326 [Salix suchowensis]|nr:hypothetical protein OIU78_027326 [Salix suchowensis]